MVKTREKIQSLIAREAARLMIDEGIECHHRAKMKAVDRLAIPNGKRLLPRDDAVDAARQEHLRLFGAPSPSRHIEDLRCLALEVMEKLESFSPRLVGSVADGTAARHSPIVIHVFPNTPEDVLFTLIDLRIPYREGQHLARCGKGGYTSLPAVSLNHPRSTVDILVFPPDQLGKSMVRKKESSAQATASDLRRILRRDPSRAETACPQPDGTNRFATSDPPAGTDGRQASRDE